MGLFQRLLPGAIPYRGLGALGRGVLTAICMLWLDDGGSKLARTEMNNMDRHPGFFCH